MVPDEKDDLNKFADEIFGSHDKSESPGDASGESTSAHKKRVARITDKDKWAQATNNLKVEYQQLARHAYEDGEYAGQEDLLHDIRQGKVFIFRAGNDLRVGSMLSLGVAVFFGILSLSGIGSFQESVILFMVCFIPMLLIGMVYLFKTIRSLLVVGPSGIVWRNGGILWEDVEKMNASVKTVSTRYGPRQRYDLWFQLWDGTARSIAIHNRSHECPGEDPNRFVSQVVKEIFDVHGAKNLK